MRNLHGKVRVESQRAIIHLADTAGCLRRLANRVVESDELIGPDIGVKLNAFANQLDHLQVELTQQLNRLSSRRNYVETKERDRPPLDESESD